MKNISLTAFILFTMLNSYGQIQKIEIEPRPPDPLNACFSDCETCGVVIFTTDIPDLSFESNMDHIKDIQIDKDGTKYTYSVIAEAKPTQLFIIQGSEIADYKLTVDSLEEGRCRDYIIKIIGEPIREQATTESTQKPTPKTFDQEKNTRTPDPDKIAGLNQDIKKHKKKQVIWLSSAIVTAGIGGYLKYAADQKYDEYLAGSDPDEIASLKETVQLYDKLTPVFFGLAGACTVGFVVQTVKKGKKRRELQVEMNGRGAGLTYRF